MNFHPAMLRRLCLLLCCLAGGVSAQTASKDESAALQAAQRQAMAPLAALDGTWRGPARVFLPGGGTHELTQTERVGSMQGGTLKVLEGRGYGADGQLEFNAFAVISFSPRTGQYGFRSYAQGQQGDFAFEARPDGFVWTMVFGTVTMRQTAVIKDDTWTEIGERLVAGQPPVRMVEMNLRRIGPTTWPQEGAVPPR